MVTWGIWHQRNQVRNNKACCTSDQLTLQAKEKLAEYLVVLPPTLPALLKPKERWKPLDASLVKINFDGARFSGMRTEAVLEWWSVHTQVRFLRP